MISSLELARLCGVSQGTVDRALHDRPGISPRTKARVLDMARRHGYAPHPAAQELLSGRSHVLGVIVPNFSHFFTDLLNALQRAANAASLRLFISPADGPDAFQELLAEMAARRFRGVVAVPPQDALCIPAPVTRALRVATLLTDCDGAHCRLFAPDEVATGRHAVEALVARGHRRILHLTYARRARAIRDRQAGYDAAMRAADLDPVSITGTDPAALLAAVDRHAATALFCHNDWLALAAIRALQAAGRRVPADLAVLGVDHSPAFTALYPGIASLHYPADAVAEAAITWLAAPDDDAPTPPIPDLALAPGDTL